MAKTLNTNAFLANLKKQMESKSIKISHDVYPTGVFPLDFILGGGIKAGRLIEIYGSEGAGKTTLVYSVLGAYQKMFPDKGLVFIDFERTFDEEWAAKCGLENNNQFILISPRYGNDIDDILNEVFKVPNSISVIALDSLGSILYKEEEDDPNKVKVGLEAMNNKQNFKKIVKRLQETNTIFIVVNQLRAKIGGYMGGKDTPGGNFMKHAYTYRVRISKREKNIKGEDYSQHSYESEIKAEKNKAAIAYLSSRIVIKPLEGLNKITNAANFLIENGVYERSGSWYYVDKEKNPDLKFQGKEALIEYLSKFPSNIKKKYKDFFTKDKVETAKGDLKIDLLDNLFVDTDKTSKEESKKGDEQ